jgi:glycosyltransferase involved in cell wall biosynthesis
VRIVHVSHYLDPARRSSVALLDAWTTLTDVAASVARGGATVTVLQAAHENAELVRCGVSVNFVREREPSRLQRRLGHWATPLQPRLLRRLAELDPDVVHLHGLSFPRHATAIRSATPRAKLLLQDHADHPARGWRSAIQRRGLSSAHGFAFTAADQAEPFRNAGILEPGPRVFEIPESSSWFVPGDREDARQRTGLRGDPCLVWLGHLDGNKDPLVILDAVGMVLERMRDLELWMCYRKAPLIEQVLSHLRANPQLSARVHLLGEQPRDRVELMLRAADFLVQGSHSEGSGYSVIEAMACGTAPMVTDIPSFRMLTNQGRFGALFPPGNAQALRNVLETWAARPRASLRQEVRTHFERELSFDAIGRKLMAAYSALLST